MGDVAGVHRIRGDNNDAMPGSHCAKPRRGGGDACRRSAPVRAGHASTATPSGAGCSSARWCRARPGSRLTRFMVRQVFEPLAMTRTVVGETDGLDDGCPVTLRSRSWAYGSASRSDAAGLLLSRGRWRVSLHADGPRATRLRDAEARAVEGGDDRRLPDAHAPRVRSVDDICAGLDGQRASSSPASPHGSSVTAAVPWAAPSRS